MTARETAPLVKRGDRITVYPEWPGVIAAIRWNKYAGWTYGIRRDDDGRVFYVWESQVAEALATMQDAAALERAWRAA